MMPAPIELEFTQAGYLLLPASIAKEFFPQDTLVVLVKGDELWLLPTRGAAAGGLLLKQRNAAGDRSVLVGPLLSQAVPAGRWPAFWDERAAALRVALRPVEPGIAAAAVVEKENGRWVVYLEVGFWETQGEDGPVRTERKRIADYPSEQSAKIAAQWIERTADRKIVSPQLGY